MKLKRYIILFNVFFYLTLFYFSWLMYGVNFFDFCIFLIFKTGSEIVDHCQ